MKIQLYVYDLSRGLARQMSQPLLGFQIDAVYHTSLAFDGIEYFFGAGIQTSVAGATHHGRPMEVHDMGDTDLPKEVILEYLESLREVYTPESYDLFAHNCNNFSNDLAQFLVGKGIPEHIVSLPERVLESPFGQMLRPQIESAMRPTTTYAPPQASISNSKSSSPPSQKVQQHPHTALRLPHLLRQSTEPVTYRKAPPLDKVLAKFEAASITDPLLERAASFIKIDHQKARQEAALPDLQAIGEFLDRAERDLLPPESSFAAIDIWRALVADPRASSFFVQNPQSLLQMLNRITDDASKRPYSSKLTAAQLCCNLFLSSIPFGAELTEAMVQLTTHALLTDRDRVTLRVASSSLALNLATLDVKFRTQGQRHSNERGLTESQQVELAACLIETITAEQDSPEAINGLVLAVARLAFEVDLSGEVADVFRALEASKAILSKRSVVGDKLRPLLTEVGQELLEKGLTTDAAAA